MRSLPHRTLLFTLTVVFTVALDRGVVAARDDSAPAPIYPKSLAPGDTIMIVAPAKYVDKIYMARAKRRLEELGFSVRMPEPVFRKNGFLAGSDDQRASALMEAFSDPEVDAIFPGTGGYGTTRIIDKLDYDLIRRNPKIFVGFSDITALHVAINQRTGLVTFHSPNLESRTGLGGEKGFTPFSARWFWQALSPSLIGRGQGRVRLAPEQLAAGRKATTLGYAIETHPPDDASLDDASIFDYVPRPITIAKGKADGRLIGGNLSVVHAMMGTPFEIQTDGRILFLEDVGEAPYRVDRMLRTFRLAGKFDRVAGVVLGQFTARKEDADWDDDATVDDVLRDYFADLGVPVLANFPFGHVPYNATLPVGALAELDATRRTLRLLENPVTP